MKRLFCPSCNTPTLKAFSIDDHELEKCETCHGLWFDEPELMNYIESHADELTKGFNIIQEESNPLESARFCHDCNKPMVEHELIPKHKTYIDACHSCDTFWVNRESIKHVQHSHDLREALTKINAGFTWRSWFFQLMLRMPVEYNAKSRAIPLAMYSIFILNILFFLLRFISPGAGDWATHNLSIITPIYDTLWFIGTLISAQFMHGDLMHIFGNLYFLWVIGDNIEDALGKKRFVLAYLITGTAGMLLEVIFAVAAEREMMLLGASAAVSGLFGMYIVWFRHAKLSVMMIVFQFRLPAYWFLGIWALTNLYGLFSGGFGVAYLAHLGGFVAGLIFAVVYRGRVYKNNPLLYLLNNKPHR